MDDVRVAEVLLGSGPSGVGDAIVGVEVIDDLQDGRISRRPAALGDRPGRVVDLGVR